LRTPQVTGDAHRPTEVPAEARSAIRSSRLKPIEPMREPPTPAPTTDTAPPRAQPVRPVRREGQLGGLLHGELLEALQGLR
jgi:hypothetical protein